MIHVSRHRRRFDGMLQILRFNVHLYLGAVLFIAATVPVLAVARVPRPVEWAAWLAVGCVAYWTAASLVVSHWVYDRSALTRWSWLKGLPPKDATYPARWINVHTGFDSTTARLSEVFRSTPAQVIDLYDPRRTTEPSLAVARRESHLGSRTVCAQAETLPLSDHGTDTAFVLLAAHEMREREMRREFFGELYRVLAPGGRVVLVEHTRDLWNFFAFGPGALHFYSQSEWLRLAERAGFRVTLPTKVTPFITTFVLEKDNGPGSRDPRCGNTSTVAGRDERRSAEQDQSEQGPAATVAA